MEKVDIPQLIGISEEFFREYSGYHEIFASDPKPSHIKKFFEQAISSRSSAGFVAVAGREIIGYTVASLRKRPDFYKERTIGHVSALMVKRGWRRKGIGREMMKAVTRFFRKRGVRWFTLSTSVRNRKALAFYKSIGMEKLRLEMIGKVG